VDNPKNLKYDYTYKPPGPMVSPAAGQLPINDLLSPGEHVLWSGQPPQGLVVLRAQDLAIVPFFVVWTGFSLFWEAMAVGMLFVDGESLLSPALCMPLFGLPFVGIGLYMLGGRFIMDIPVRRNTYYALTDRRAMIVSGVRDRNVTSMPLDKIENVDMTLHRNGCGTLKFAGDRNVRMARVNYSMNGINYGVPTFDHIQEPKRVYDLVLKAQDDLMVRQHGYVPEGRSDEK
jgi:hypothetical protein